MNQGKNSGGAATRLLLVEDHPVFRKGLTHILAQAGGFEICAEAESASEALRAFGDSKPDLVITDLALQGALALDLIKQMRALDAKARILVVSMHDEMIFGERAIGAGADGYVNKADAADKIVEAARRLLEGKMFVGERLAERIMHHRARAADVDPSDPGSILSDRELEIFGLLGQGHSSRTLGKKLSLSAKTVESYRARIKEKLGIEANAELIQRSVEWNLNRSLDTSLGS